MPIISRYQVDRGRANEMDRTGAGTATITMIDTNRSLDPVGGGTYEPLTPIAIALGGAPIFTGYVSRWGYEMYPNEQYGVATIDCVDGMDVLAAAEMTPGAYGDPATNLANLGNVVYDKDPQVKTRIDQVLDDTGWPTGLREVFTGNVPLQKTVYSPRQPAINAITDAADAEFPGVANFYMAKDGKATFHGRLARFNPTNPQYGITTWNVGDIANSSGRAVIYGLDYDRDKDRIINSALATPENIADDDIEAQRVQNAASIAAYGTRSWSAENLILEGSWLTGNTAVDECRLVYATYYVTNYRDPQTRVTRLTFKNYPGATWSSANQALVSGIDISDRIHLLTATGFNAYFFVEGLHYVVEPASDSFLNVTLDVDVSPAAYWNTLPG